MSPVYAGKLLAFSGPSASPYMIGTYTTHTPEDYHRYFTHKGITAVVRLNNKVRSQATCSPHVDTLLFAHDIICRHMDTVYLNFLYTVLYPVRWINTWTKLCV